MANSTYQLTLNPILLDNYSFGKIELDDFQLSNLNLILSKLSRSKEATFNDSFGIEWEFSFSGFIDYLFNKVGDTGPFLIITRNCLKWADIISNISGVIPLIYRGNQQERKLIRNNQMFNEDKTLKFNVLISTTDLSEIDFSSINSVYYHLSIFHNFKKVKYMPKSFKTIRYTQESFVTFSAESQEIKNFTDESFFNDSDFEKQQEKIENFENLLTSIPSELPLNSPNYYYINCPPCEIQKTVLKHLLFQPEHNFSLLCQSILRVCSHPFLVFGTENLLGPVDYIQSSTKLSVFTKLVTEQLKDARKILVISQFNGMLDLIEDFATENNISFNRLINPKIDYDNQDVFLMLYNPLYCQVDIITEFIDYFIILDGDHSIILNYWLNNANRELKAIFTLQCQELFETRLTKICMHGLNLSNRINNNDKNNSPYQSTKSKNNSNHLMNSLKFQYSYSYSNKDAKQDYSQLQFDEFMSELLCRIASTIVMSPTKEFTIDSLIENMSNEPIETGSLFDLQFCQDPNFWEILSNSIEYKIKPEFPLVRFNVDTDKHHWTSRERDQLIRGLLAFGWDRWDEIIHNGGLHRISKELIIHVSRVFLRFLLRSSPNSPFLLIRQFIRESSNGDQNSSLINDEKQDQMFMEKEPIFSQKNFQSKMKSNADFFLRRIESLSYLRLTVENYVGNISGLPISRTIGNSPTITWTGTHDRYLLIGSYKYGYGSYDHFPEDQDTIYRDISYCADQILLDERLIKLTENLKRMHDAKIRPSYEFYNESENSDNFDDGYKEKRENNSSNSSLRKENSNNSSSRREKIQNKTINIKKPIPLPEISKTNEIQQNIRINESPKIKLRVSSENKTNKKANENKVTESKANENKANKNKTNENKVIENKINDDNEIKEPTQEIKQNPKTVKTTKRNTAKKVEKESEEYNQESSQTENESTDESETSEYSEEYKTTNSRNSRTKPVVHKENMKELIHKEQAQNKVKASPKPSQKQTQVNINSLSIDDFTFPVQIKATSFIINIGEIVYDRPAFHTNRYIYPAGFKSMKQSTSIDDPNEKVNYISEIIDNGSEYPLFRVTMENSNHVFEGSTPTAPWTNVLKEISNQGKRKYYSISGPEAFMLSEPKVKCLIELLPNVDKCEKYEHKAAPNSVINELSRICKESKKNKELDQNQTEQTTTSVEQNNENENEDDKDNAEENINADEFNDKSNQIEENIEQNDTEPVINDADTPDELNENIKDNENEEVVEEKEEEKPNPINDYVKETEVAESDDDNEDDSSSFEEIMITRTKNSPKSKSKNTKPPSPKQKTKSPKLETKSPKLETKSPKLETKSPKSDTKLLEQETESIQLERKKVLTRSPRTRNAQTRSSPKSNSRYSEAERISPRNRSRNINYNTDNEDEYEEENNSKKTTKEKSISEEEESKDNEYDEDYEPTFKEKSRPSRQKPTTGHQTRSSNTNIQNEAEKVTKKSNSQSKQKVQYKEEEEETEENDEDDESPYEESPKLKSNRRPKPKPKPKSTNSRKITQNTTTTTTIITDNKNNKNINQVEENPPSNKKIIQLKEDEDEDENSEDVNDETESNDSDSDFSYGSQTSKPVQTTRRSLNKKNFTNKEVESTKKKTKSGNRKIINDDEENDEDEYSDRSDFSYGNRRKPNQRRKKK